jgi:hypothetical protein
VLLRSDNENIKAYWAAYNTSPVGEGLYKSPPNNALGQVGRNKTIFLCELGLVKSENQITSR